MVPKTRLSAVTKHRYSERISNMEDVQQFQIVNWYILHRFILQEENFPISVHMKGIHILLAVNTRGNYEPCKNYFLQHTNLKMPTLLSILRQLCYKISYETVVEGVFLPFSIFSLASLVQKTSCNGMHHLPQQCHNILLIDTCVYNYDRIIDIDSSANVASF